jgi:hypothetical protein
MKVDKSTQLVYQGLMRHSKDIRHNVDMFSGWLHQFITGRMWESGWYDELKGVLKAPTLFDFITRRIPDGIESDPVKIYAELYGSAQLNPEVAKGLNAMVKQLSVEGFDVERAYKGDKLDAVTKVANQHTGIVGDNITYSSDRGTSETYTIARLKRSHPDLASKVVAGELSANAAAIQAGFRRPMMQVPADDYEAAIRKVNTHYGK